MGSHVRFRSPSLFQSLLVLATFPVLIYANIFASSFLFDDTHLILQNLGIRHFDDLRMAMVYDTPSRPVMMLSFALNYYLGGLQVFGYHLANLTLHILTSLLLFVIVLKSPCSLKRETRHSLALLSALLFAIHPVLTESITYTSSRSALMAAFLYMLAFYCFLRFHQSTSPTGRQVCYMLAILSFFLSLWAKEIAITLPAVLILYDFFFLFHAETGTKGSLPGLPYRVMVFLEERRKCYWPFLAAIILFFIIRYFYLGEVLEKESAFVQTHGRFVYFLTQCRVIPYYYLVKLLSPFNLNLDPDFPLAPLSPVSTSLLSIGSLILVILCAFFLLKKSIAAAFALFFFLITLTPTSSLVPILDVVAEHRLYLPAAGFMILPAMCLRHLLLSVNGKVSPAFRVTSILVLPFLFLSATTIERNRVYQTPETVWRDTVSKSPRKARPYFGLGYYYDRTGRLEKALAFYRKALSIEPYYASLHMTIGALYNRMGLPGKALGHAKTAVDLNSKEALYHNLLGDVYQKLGMFEKSVREFTKTIHLKPLYAPGYFNLGNCYAQRKEYEKAIGFYEKALKFDPDLTQAKENLRAARALRKMTSTP